MTSNQFETPDIESSTDDYAGRFSGEVGRWFLDVQNQATQESIKGLQGEALVLDAGGGHAQNVEVVLSQGYRLHILGSDESCAKRLATWQGMPEVIFDTGYLVNMPYAADSFNCALSYRMLPHLNEWKKHIEELCRVSSERVVIEYPSQYSINFFSEGLFFLKKKIESNTRPFTLFRPADVEAEFARYGFYPTGRIGQYFFPMVLYRALKKVCLCRAIEWLPKSLGLNRFFGSPIIQTFERR